MIDFIKGLFSKKSKLKKRLIARFPNPKSKQIRVKPHTYYLLKAYADETRNSVGNVVQIAIVSFLKTISKEANK